MMTLDERVQKKKETAKRVYERSLESAEREAIQEHLMDTLGNRIKGAMPGVNVSATGSALWVYLSKDYNISKDWMIFLEENEDFIKVCGKTEAEYKFKHDQEFGTYDYNYGDINLYVNYGEGKCKRVKVGETTETVTKEIYEVQCL